MLTVSEAQSIIIMAESMAAGRNGTGEVAKSYILTCIWGGVDFLGLAWAFKTSKFTASDTLPPAGLYLLIFLILSNGSVPW